MRLIASISDAAIAVIDAGSQRFTVTTFDMGTCKPLSPDFDHTDVTLGSGKVRRIDVSQLFGMQLTELEKAVPTCSWPAKAWFKFDIQLQNGRLDQAILLLDAHQETDMTQYFLKAVWPLLRQDCVQEIASQKKQKEPSDPLSEGWDLLNRIDVAMIILSPKSEMVRVNVAARELLDSGAFLKRGNGGIFAAVRDETCGFHKAVAQAAQLRGKEDIVFFLSSKSGRKRVPVTLSRYYYRGKPTEYVVAMLPTPPSSRRVERLVKQMGLTSSEARVAALMQLGLSNREAAEVSGLKPQTLNTYAKRILNKLNVSGRTEMAQLLTWQASGGRSA